jgi:hypothetical protein
MKLVTGMTGLASDAVVPGIGWSGAFNACWAMSWFGATTTGAGAANGAGRTPDLRPTPEAKRPDPYKPGPKAGAP